MPGKTPTGRVRFVASSSIFSTCRVWSELNHSRLHDNLMKLVGEDVGETQTHISLSLSASLSLALSLLSLLLVVCFFHRGTTKSASLYLQSETLQTTAAKKKWILDPKKPTAPWNFVENLHRFLSPQKKSPVFYSGEKCSLEFPQNLPCAFFLILRGRYFLTKSPAFAG